MADLSHLNLRTSAATAAKLVSSSLCSKGAVAQRSGFFYVRRSRGMGVAEYKVGDIFRVSQYNHKEVVKGLKTWLTDILQTHSIEVESEVNLKLCNMREVFTSSTIKADVSVGDRNNTFLQFEVISDNNREATIWKLAFGLSLHLHHLRNSDIHVNKIVGFCVPVNRGYFEKVECEWSDEDLKHLIEVTKLHKDEVLSSVKTAFTRQCYPDIVKKGLALCFPLVLSPSFIHHSFASDGFQHPSGQSFVIMSNINKCVYKLPFSSTECFTLKKLRRLQRKPEGASFPIGIKQVDGMDYFVFKLYSPPLNTTQAKHHIKHFIPKLAHCINELHAINIAHMDIRLENVCIDQERQSVILIDLDRSVAVNETLPEDMMYGKSEMYTEGKEEWCCGNADWRQLSILIINILNTNPMVGYHELTATDRHDLYIQNLFHEG